MADHLTAIGLDPPADPLDPNWIRTRRASVNTITTKAEAYAHHTQGETVHAAWVVGKVQQGRQVNPERANWSQLHAEDKAVDAAIAIRIATHAIAFAEGPGRDQQLALLPEIPPATLTIHDWASPRGGQLAHDTWHDTMVVQGRHIPPQLKHWPDMPTRDQQLFIHIATVVGADAIRWYKAGASV